MKSYLVTTAIMLSACSHRAESTSTVAEPTPPPATAPPTLPPPLAEPPASASAQAQQAMPDTAAKPHFNAPPGTVLVAEEECIHGVDAAPGKPASPSLPAGSIYIGCATIRWSSDHKKEERVPTMIEWDVAGSRVLQSVDLPLRPPTKEADKVRIATFGNNVYITVTPTTTTGGGKSQLVALDADLHPRETRSLGTSTDVSLEVNEKYLAVSYRPCIDDSCRHPIKIELFDANNLTPIATRSVGSAELFWSSGYALEFFGDRLYVAGVPDFTIPRGQYMPTNVPFVGVFAMSLPSLEIVRTYNAKNSYRETTLQSIAKHIILTGEEGYEELTADLKLIRKHKGVYAEAFDPKTGRAFSCRNLEVPSGECCCGGICFCHALWTGLEAAIVADINDHIIFGRLKDLPGKSH